jgi:hypothetical protein
MMPYRITDTNSDDVAIFTFAPEASAYAETRGLHKSKIKRVVVANWADWTIIQASYDRGVTWSTIASFKAYDDAKAYQEHHAAVGGIPLRLAEAADHTPFYGEDIPPHVKRIRLQTGGAPPWPRPFSPNLIIQIQRAHEYFPGPKTWCQLKEIVDFLGGPEGGAPPCLTKHLAKRTNKQTPSPRGRTCDG